MSTMTTSASSLLRDRTRDRGTDIACAANHCDFSIHAIPFIGHVDSGQILGHFALRRVAPRPQFLWKTVWKTPRTTV